MKKELKIKNSALSSAFMTCKQTWFHDRWIYVNEHQLQYSKTSPEFQGHSIYSLCFRMLV